MQYRVEFVPDGFAGMSEPVVMSHGDDATVLYVSAEFGRLSPRDRELAIARAWAGDCGEPVRVRYVDGADICGQAWLMVRDDAVTTFYMATDLSHMPFEDRRRHIEDAWAGYRALAQDGAESLESVCA